MLKKSGRQRFYDLRSTKQPGHGQWGHWLRRRVRGGVGLVGRDYLADEGIAASRDVGDIAPPLLSVAQRFSQRGDMHTQGPFLDDDIGPYSCAESLPGDHLTSLLDERDEQIPCPAAEPHRQLAFEQELLRRKQAERTERELARTRKVACHPASFC